MKKFSYLAAIATGLLLCSLNATAQSVNVSGFVTDSETGAPLEGANIYIPSERIGGTSVKNGSFGFRIQKGKRIVLSVSFVGYTTQRHELTADRDTVLRIALTQDNRLSGVSVYASRRNFGVRSSQMSAIDLPVEQVKAMPALFGEADVMKAIQRLPGVNPAGEGNAGILVRGGKYDENLIMLDGATLYNAEHLKGFVSALNADMIESISFYKGAFPARYGSRLSSILDIGIKEGDFDKHHAEIGAGLLASRIHIEGPIFRGKTSFNIAARASYMDAIVQPMLEEIYDKPDAVKAFARMNYYDINAKVVHRFSDRNKVSAVFYNGKDINDAAPSDSRQIIEITSPRPEDNKTYDNTKNNSTDNSWGNTVSSLFWTHSFDENFSMNANLNFSRFKYDLTSTNLENRKIFICRRNSDSGVPDLLSSLYDEDSYATYRTGIYDYGAAVDFLMVSGTRHNLRWGAKYSLQHFTPTVDVYKKTYSKKLKIGSEDVYIENSTFKDTTLGKNHDLGTMSVYMEDDWSISERLKANLGIRCAIYLAEGKRYTSIEPRVSLRYLVNANMALKFSYSRMSQGFHLLSSSNLVMPSDIWVPATENTPLEKGDQMALGVSYDMGRGIELSVEGYRKLTENTVDYREGTSYMTTSGDWENLIALGKGDAYGVEFFLQKKTGRTNGWISYTWSKSMRKYDRPGQEIFGGETFYDGNDRRHNMNITLMHRFNRHWDISAAWSYMTGRRGNIATTAMYGGKPLDMDSTPYYFDSSHLYEVDPDRPLNFYDFKRYYTYTERNGFKLPDSHHLDLSVNYSCSFPKGDMIIGLTLYNIYNRKNPSYTYIGYRKNKTVLKSVCLLPFMPSLNFTLKF